jgi:3-hydroxyisobutyrate dehydrogenase-like beta-hydroxyacid dehydrogenase
MLADDTAIADVLSDDVLAGAPTNLLHINMATVSVDCSRALSAKHKALGQSYVGAPVFGRAEVAAAGQLNIVAAGADADLVKAEPLFAAMGKKTWRVGSEPEHAHLLKIGGNFMLATTIELLSEAITLMEKAGVDPKAFVDVMTNTLFAAPAFKIYGDLINEKRFEPAGFTMRLGLKDVGLALAAAQGSEMPLPLASLVRDHMLEGLASGRGQQDWSALSDVVRRKAGL